MLRSLSGLFGRPGALVTSVALHVGAVVVGGHGLSEGTQVGAGAVVPAEIDVQLFDVPPPPVAPSTNTEEPRPAAPVRAPGAGHRHAYPVPADHDAHPHDPSLVHVAGRSPLETPPAEAAPAVTAAPTLAATSPDATPRFVLGTAAGTARGSVTPERAEPVAATGGSRVPGMGTLDSPVLPESAVDQPARILSTVPVVYPESARAAGMEADVPLEIVVDGSGRVTSARHLAAQGLGLAEAALKAVRSYRFTPARRAGRTVPVRMRWIVTFRLE